MKRALLITYLLIYYTGFAQNSDKITTIEFVQILNDNYKETRYYYENNWMALREMAIKNNYIHSYDIIETPFSQEHPFHIILITTYKDKPQYDKREMHFEELIKARGALQLMNEKQPKDFRKSVFTKEMVRHWK